MDQVINAIIEALKEQSKHLLYSGRDELEKKQLKGIIPHESDEQFDSILEALQDQGYITAMKGNTIIFSQEKLNLIFTLKGYFDR